MANNTSPRSTKPTAGKSGSGRTAFYAVLILVIVGGIGAILYQMRDKKDESASTETNPVYEQMKQRYANAGPPQPHLLGKPDAPVVIEEFADFECPSCGRYATITEPDVRHRIVEAGLASYKYYDFPLPGHGNTQAASNAAACAEEQGKFWEMHDALFNGQPEWGLGEGEGQVTDQPKPIFVGYAKKLGLDMTRWESCFDAKKYQSRIDANGAEAVRRNVQQTPTFFINGVKMAGALTYDEMKKAVADAASKGPMSATDSAMGNIVKH